MSANQGASSNPGDLCCWSWGRKSNSARRIKMGILLIAAGMIWLTAHAGLIDLSWLRAVPFWPAALMALGAWMICGGLVRKSQEGRSSHGKEAGDGNGV